MAETAHGKAYRLIVQAQADLTPPFWDLPFARSPGDVAVVERHAHRGHIGRTGATELDERVEVHPGFGARTEDLAHCALSAIHERPMPETPTEGDTRQTSPADHLPGRGGHRHIVPYHDELNIRETLGLSHQSRQPEMEVVPRISSSALRIPM